MRAPSRCWLDRVPFEAPAVWRSYGPAWRRQRRAWLRKACGPSAETARAFALRARDLLPGEQGALFRVLGMQAGEGPGRMPGVRELRAGDLPGWDLRTALRPEIPKAITMRCFGGDARYRPVGRDLPATPLFLALLLSVLAAAAYQRQVNRAGREARLRLGAA